MNAVNWIAMTMLGILTSVTIVTAEAPRPKTEREWKRVLSAPRFEETITRAEVEKRLGDKVVAEFDLDHGFALLRDVYYELDAEWYAHALYRSPRGANITPDTPRAAMRLVTPPLLVRNTPELHERIQRLKELPPNTPR